jgi:hypothetical protein
MPLSAGTEHDSEDGAKAMSNASYAVRHLINPPWRMYWRR